MDKDWLAHPDRIIIQGFEYRMSALQGTAGLTILDI